MLKERFKVPDVLSLASSVFDGLSSRDIDDLEALALDRSYFSRSLYPPSLFDTNILSELFKGNPSVKIRASEYLRDRNRLTISLITKHEILKGLLAKKAQKQIDSFIAFCKANVAW